jgi:hypothetical protein
MSTQPMRPGLRATLSLEYPMSLGVYDSYDDAQRAVDYLSDHEFPVQDVLIVGTDLKQLERVTGRLTRGRVISGGALSGAWFGLLIGTIFALFESGGFNILSVVATMAFGAVFGVIWTAVVYRVTSGGQRDFTSVSLVVAAKYELLCEHKHAQRGREMLVEMDPMRAAEQEVRRAREAEQARAAQQAPVPPQPWEQPQQPHQPHQPQQSQQPPPPPVP